MQGAVTNTGRMGDQPSIYQPGLLGGCAEDEEEGEDRDGGTYIQEILHGGVEHHQVREEGAKVGDGALHHTLRGQQGTVGSAESWDQPGQALGRGHRDSHARLTISRCCCCRFCALFGLISKVANLDVPSWMVGRSGNQRRWETTTRRAKIHPCFHWYNFACGWEEEEITAELCHGSQGGEA